MIHDTREKLPGTSTRSIHIHLLNLISGNTVETNKRTEKHTTDDVWVTVESKQERKAKRLQSCMNTGKTRSVSRMNGKSGFR